MNRASIYTPVHLRQKCMSRRTKTNLATDVGEGVGVEVQLGEARPPRYAGLLPVHQERLPPEPLGDTRETHLRMGDRHHRPNRCRKNKMRFCRAFKNRLDVVSIKRCTWGRNMPQSLDVGVVIEGDPVVLPRDFPPYM